MAQLKSTVVQGSLRATDSIYTNELQTKIIQAPTASNETTYGPGTADYVLMSNGTSVYWGTGVTNALKALDVSTIGNTNGTKYIAAISQADGKISATTIDVATAYSSTGTTAISGTGVAAALGTLDVDSVGGDTSYISAISESNGKISATNKSVQSTYSSTGTLAINGTGVAAALGTLDGNLNNTTPGAGKTLTAFSQTNGKVSATFGDISITASQAGLGDVSNNADLNGASGEKGDIIYWSAENTPAHLTNTTSTTKHFLSITSQVPAWSTISKSDVGLGNVTNDAQVKASLGTAKGDILYWSANATPARLAIGSNGRFLTVSSGAPAWAALPTANSSTAGIMKLGASGGAATYEHTHKIDGVTGSTITRYGVCNTSASNPDKSVTITNGTFTLETGARVTVKFTNGQEQPASFTTYMTLNVNGTGAKTIYRDTGIPIIPYFDWPIFSKNLLDFVYDGTNWVIVGINNQSTLELFYQDFTINSLNISTDGTTTYTVTLDSRVTEIWAVNIKRAWPASNWNNGALVNIVQWDDIGDGVSFTLSTTSAQNYGLIIRVIYYKVFPWND